MTKRGSLSQPFPMGDRVNEVFFLVFEDKLRYECNPKKIKNTSKMRMTKLTLINPTYLYYYLIGWIEKLKNGLFNMPDSDFYGT